MDNIKKFEDFLDRMHGLLDNAKKQGHIIVRVEDLENTFPELKESEDERIRKALIRFHKSTIDVDGIKGEDIIAWLETQGEPIDDNIITRDDEILQAISVGLTDAVKDLGWSDFGGLPIEEIQEWLEKQGEKKSSTWSKDDEAGLCDALWAIKQATNIAKDENDMGNLWYAEDWLKSLKQRIGG